MCCTYCNPSPVYLNYKYKVFQRAAANSRETDKGLRYIFQKYPLEGTQWPSSEGRFAFRRLQEESLKKMSLTVALTIAGDSTVPAGRIWGDRSLGLSQIQHAHCCTTSPSRQMETGQFVFPVGFGGPFPRSGASIQSRCMPGLAGVGAPSHSWQTVHHCVSFPFFPLLLSDLQEEKLWGWPRCQLVWHSWGFLKTCIFYTAGHWHGWYRSISNPLIKQQWSLFHGQSIFIVLITRDYFKCVADKCPL